MTTDPLPRWCATIRPRIWTIFVVPVMVGCLAQLALLSPSKLGECARGNAMWVVMVPLYASIVIGITNVLISRRVTYSVHGDALVVSRWWRRRTYSLAGGSIAFSKWSTSIQGVTGTLLVLTLRETTIKISGKDFLFADAAHYTLPSGAPHVPVMDRDAFTSLVSAIVAATDGRARTASTLARSGHLSTTSIELSVSGSVLVVRWSWGSMFLMMVAAVAGAFAERFVPALSGSMSLIAAAGSLLVAGPLLYLLLRVPAYRLEFAAGRVVLRRGTDLLLADAPVDALSITRGRHLIGRGGGTIPTLVLGFPSGRRVRVGATGVAVSERDLAPASWLFSPRHTVGALEWPILLRCLGQPDAR